MSMCIMRNITVSGKSKFCCYTFRVLYTKVIFSYLMTSSTNRCFKLSTQKSSTTQVYARKRRGSTQVLSGLGALLSAWRSFWTLSTTWTFLIHLRVCCAKCYARKQDQRRGKSSGFLRRVHSYRKSKGSGRRGGQEGRGRGREWQQWGSGRKGGQELRRWRKWWKGWRRIKLRRSIWWRCSSLSRKNMEKETSMADKQQRWC